MSDELTKEPTQISADISLSDAKAKQEQKANDYEGMALILSEYAFVALPLLVIMFIFLFIGKTTREIFASPEWSFASSILVGQLIVKSVSNILRLKATSWRFVSAYIALLIVLGLVPSLLTLTMILIVGKPSLSLIGTQISLFGVASYFFIVFGGASESVLIGREDKNQKE